MSAEVIDLDTYRMLNTPGYNKIPEGSDTWQEPAYDYSDSGLPEDTVECSDCGTVDAYKLSTGKTVCQYCNKGMPTGKT